MSEYINKRVTITLHWITMTVIINRRFDKASLNDLPICSTRLAANSIIERGYLASNLCPPPITLLGPKKKEYRRMFLTQARSKRLCMYEWGHLRTAFAHILY